VHGSFLCKTNVVSEILWNGNIPDIRRKAIKNPTP
jgi:hypothetical protein